MDPCASVDTNVLQSGVVSVDTVVSQSTLVAT